MNVKPMTQTLRELNLKIEQAEQVNRIIKQIQCATNLDQIVLDLHHDILSLFDAQDLTLFAVDADKKEIFFKIPQVDSVEEFRIPITEQSLAGFCAKYLRPVNVADAYNAAELRSIHPALLHDSTYDKRTGFKTKQVLTYPIVADNKYLMGVIQLLNKKAGSRFTRKDEESVAEIAKALGTAFYNLKNTAKKNPTRFDLLLNGNRLTQTDLDNAIAESRKGVNDLETILLEKYKVPKSELGKSLAQFYKCPYIEYSERTVLDVELLKNLNLDYLKKNHWIPLRRDRASIEILTDDPGDLDRVQDIKRTFPGLNIRFAVGLRRDIAQFLAAGQGDGGGRKLDESVSDILGELVTEAQAEAMEEAAAGGLDENDSAIVRLANQIIADAYRQNASDIHIEPYGEKRETVVRFRVDGECFEYMKIPQSYRRAIVSRIKIMASLDIAERRKPQDGKIKFKLSDTKEIELRVATIPTAGYNEDVVLRILAASEPLPLDQMGFSERNLKALKEISEKPYGIILCVGPTGSGKTTTLHSVLGHINTPDIKIWTAEDPVEITQYGLRQVQVQPKIGFTFAAAMRAFLRADPDVIMVGEMRDKETADMGIEASLTGHLVLSTLHTNSAVETVTRLLDMGCDPFSFADAMLGVLAQRLARRLCKDCKEQYVCTPEEYAELRSGYGAEQWDRLGVKQDNTFHLYRAKGCETCNRSGFRGRIALHELLLGTDEIKRMIQRRATTEEMLKTALAQGMTTLLQDGIQKVLQGQTTYKEVKAVAIK
ncbi:GspE/PulE family protein [Candidatus Nitrospira inopinata]|jgi:type II secretory ATPase GspE/PulE/Tfp pilus assembly ATPase PilB-like protein|uniref:General secretion pathway protein E, contains GAF domain n=1 Tax=Candidatus Nitrospira inopinata TaxID=1715989 RepID=A0A0S4KRI2_9BACT|nr:GspE/PulE family protein [Candidatus Nitrospira inopinata]CUQ66951.1 General secretion pathway protein E, contains GAF domain [Candidatus Nitrospira inopinata]